MKRLTILLLVAVFAFPLAAAKRAFTIEDLYRALSISDFDVSPDGKSVAFTITTSDLPRGKRLTQIWMMDVDGANRRQITFHDKGASTPRFSPDGKWLSFISSRDGDANLYLMPLTGGGEPKRLTNVSTGVSDPLWSPDGKWIAFATDVYPECAADDGCNKKIAQRWQDGPLKAHMADTLLYRHWTSWKDGTRTHVFVASTTDGKTRDVTPGDFDSPPFSLGGPTPYDFSPDSKELVFASNRDKEQASSTNSDLWLVSLSGDASKPKNITASNRAFDSSPSYSPDGKWIAYRMQTQPGSEADHFRLAVYDRATGASKVLTQSFNDWVEDFEWLDDSRSIVFTSGVEGINPIFRLDVGSGAINRIFADKTIDHFELVNDEKSIIYIKRSVGEPSELYSSVIGSGSPKRLTDINAKLMDEVDIRPAESMWVDGADGKRVHVFIVKPHNFDPAKKYPLILNVHGGPQQMWADAFRGDWQVYPGAGYVVAFPNPHGSVGYGQEYTAAISRDWAGKVFEDLMKVTDALEKLPYVDKNRMGAMGWSYGGYMMNWFEGHTDRFKAIASMMGLYDLRSFYGATEELWFPEWDLGGQPWNSDLYEKWSPSNYVKNFKTPCLVISGELDYRVPYTQSLQMFTALQKMNVPSRLIIYPNAGHWPSWYEMALYYTAHLEWFEKYLGGGGAPWTTEAFLRNAVFDKASGERIEQPKKTDESGVVETDKAKKPAAKTKDTKGKQDQKPATP